MDLKIDIVELESGDATLRAAVATFYERCGYRGELRDSDRTLVAVFDGAVVGAVRACDEEGHRVLRGLFVCPLRRRQGVGRALLAAWTERFGDREALCLPVARCEALYRQAGFEPVDVAALPPHLALRFEGYRSRGHATIAMRRAAA